MPKHLRTQLPQFADGEDVPFVCESSGLLSSSQQVITGFGVLVSLIVLTDGANNAVVTVYDSTSASGTVLAKIPVAAADGVGGEVHIMALAKTGIYIAISGTGANAIIRYIN